MSLLLLFASSGGEGGQTLTASRLDNTAVFYAATVTPGSVTLSTPLVTGTNGFFSPTVTPGSVTLTASLASNDQTFYAPTVTQDIGEQTLTPGLLSNEQTFYAPTVTRGAVDLTATRYDNGQAFYAPSVVPGSIKLTSARFDNAQAFYVPIVAIEGGAQTLTQAARFDNSQEFYPATVGGVAPAGGGSGFRMVDTPSKLWWKRKPKAMPEEVAEQKLKRVASVIERIASKQAESPEPATVQREQARQIVAPLVAEMPGFDWSAMYRYAIDRLIQQRLAEQMAAQEIERIRLLDADEDDVFLLLMAA